MSRLPVYSTDQIARYLGRGYYHVDLHWNLGATGAYPQAGELSYDTSGLGAPRAALARQALAPPPTPRRTSCSEPPGRPDFTREIESNPLESPGLSKINPGRARSTTRPRRRVTRGLAASGNVFPVTPMSLDSR